MADHVPQATPARAPQAGRGATPAKAPASSGPAAGAGRGSQAELKQAVRGQGYQQGRQTLSPQKAPAKGSGFGALGSFIDGLTARASTAREAIEAEAGQFVEAELGLEIDIPSVPGLAVALHGEVWYERYASGEQFLHVKSLTGVKYGLGKIFNVNVSLMQRLELTGESLSAAFVDAVKQCTFLLLQRAGVMAQFQDLERLAKEGPSIWDYCQALIPVYGTYQATKMAIASVGADRIHSAYTTFVAFFRNDAAVSFDASVGVVGGAGAKVRGVEGGLEVGAAIGVEDVEGKEARAFTEVSGEGRVERDNSYALIRVAKRWLEGGKTSLKVELWGAYSTSRGIDPRKRGIEILARVFGGPLFSRALGQLSSTGQGGGKLTALSELANVFIGLAAAGGVKGPALEAMSGLEINLEQKNGHWEAVEARIKRMTGSSFDAGKAEVGLKAGGFWEASADLRKLLGAGEEEHAAKGRSQGGKAHAGGAH